MKTATQPHQQNLSEFSTRDIYISSVLKQSGISLIRIESNGKQGIFVFKASEKIKEIISAYFNNELRIDPHSLFETWKSLKSMAFSAIGDVR